MKKFTSIIIAAFMVLTLAGCSENTSSSSVPSNGETVSSAESTITAEATDTADTSSATETSGAETNTHESSRPETSEPTSSAPETSEPTSSAPETSEPEISTPETTAPETTAPETTAPETTKPETTTPETTKPATTKPATTKPATTKPATTKPAATKPATTKPAATSNTPEQDEPTEVKITDPSELINTVWALFSEDEKFPVVGGDLSSEEMAEGAAPFSLDNPDELDRLTGFPASEVSKIDSAASMIHMMNTNTFSTGAYHLTDGTDAAALCQSIKDNVLSRTWMCGFPDKVIVAEVGDYIVCAFGLNETIDPYVKHLSEAYSFATIIYSEPIL